MFDCVKCPCNFLWSVTAIFSLVIIIIIIMPLITNQTIPNQLSHVTHYPSNDTQPTLSCQSLPIKRYPTNSFISLIAHQTIPNRLSYVTLYSSNDTQPTLSCHSLPIKQYPTYSLSRLGIVWWVTSDMRELAGYRLMGVMSDMRELVGYRLMGNEWHERVGWVSFDGVMWHKRGGLSQLGIVDGVMCNMR